jgi:ADP-heptose:LPS heptosyltransferase
LGLLPVCEEGDYYFWESRSYGGNGSESLGALAGRWARETFGVADAGPYIAPAAETPDRRSPLVTVSFGVGENPAKRVADPFEQEVVRRLAGRGLPVLVDEGAGGEEGRRAREAAARSGSDQVKTFQGPFAAFAAAIARSRLYVGYDSAGQHVAATCGVPLAAVFAGFANTRMLARWRPWGRGPIEVVRADQGAVLEQCLAAIERLLK